MVELHSHFLDQRHLIINGVSRLQVPKFKFDIVQKRSLGEFMSDPERGLGEKTHLGAAGSVMHNYHHVVPARKKFEIKIHLVEERFFFKTENLVHIRMVSDDIVGSGSDQNR